MLFGLHDTIAATGSDQVVKSFLIDLFDVGVLRQPHLDELRRARFGAHDNEVQVVLDLTGNGAAELLDECIDLITGPRV